MIPLNQIYWVAGFLEGEGYFSYHGDGAQVVAGQVQKDPLNKLYALIGGSIRLGKIKENPNHNRAYTWSLKGVRAAGLMMTIYSIMSQKRQDQVLKAIKEWRSHPPAAKYRKHCAKGHVFDKTNTRVLRLGYRQCKICNNLQHKNRRSR